MGKVFVFVNQKGGVGKTTSAINLGAYLSLMDKKTLLVDFDPQGNMSSGLGVDNRMPSIYEVLIKKVKVEESIKETKLKNLFVNQPLKFAYFYAKTGENKNAGFILRGRKLK